MFENISNQVLNLLRDDDMGNYLTVRSKTSLSNILSTEAVFGIYDSKQGGPRSAILSREGLILRL